MNRKLVRVLSSCIAASIWLSPLQSSCAETVPNPANLSYDEACKLGEARLDDCQYDDGIAYFTRAFQLKPNAQVLENRGRCYLSSGRFELALTDFEQALTSDTSPTIVRDKIRALIQLGRLDDAIAEVNALIARKPNDVATLKDAADIYHTMDRYDDALKILTDALKIAPNDGDIYLRRTILWGEKSMHDQALSDLNRATALLGPKVDVLLIGSQIYRQGKDFKKAHDAASAAVKADPKSSDAWAELGEDEWFMHDFKSAMTHAMKAVSLNSSCSRAHVVLAQAYLSNKEYEKSIEQANLALKFAPNATMGHIVKGQALGESGKTQQAIDFMSETIRRFPGDPAYYRLRGLYYSIQNNYEATLRDCTRAIELVPSWHSFIERANYEWDQNQWQAAAADYEEGLRRCYVAPDPSDIASCAYAEAQAGRFEEAEKRLTMAIRNKPTPDLYLRYSGVLGLQKRYKEAVAQAEHGLALDPKNQSLLSEKGTYLLRSGQPALAQAVANYMIQQKPENDYGYELKAEIAEDQKNYLAGISILSDLLHRHPKNADYLRRRARLYDRLRQFDRAREDCLAAIQIDPASTSIHEQIAWDDFLTGRKIDALHETQDILRRDHSSDVWFEMGNFEFLVGRYHQAIECFKHVSSSDPVYPYVGLATYISYLRLGNEQQAKRVLVEQHPTDKWPSPVRDFYLGRITQQQLLAKTHDNDSLTEARTYIALLQLSSGQNQDAEANLQWVVKNGNPKFWEYLMSVAMSETGGAPIKLSPSDQWRDADVISTAANSVAAETRAAATASGANVPSNSRNSNIQELLSKSGQPTAHSGPAFRGNGPLHPPGPSKDPFARSEWQKVWESTAKDTR